MTARRTCAASQTHRIAAVASSFRGHDTSARVSGVASHVHRRAGHCAASQRDAGLARRRHRVVLTVREPRPQRLHRSRDSRPQPLGCARDALCGWFRQPPPRRRTLRGPRGHRLSHGRTDPLVRGRQASPVRTCRGRYLPFVGGPLGDSTRTHVRHRRCPAPVAPSPVAHAGDHRSPRLGRRPTVFPRPYGWPAHQA
jgi:hypothetical protein